MTNNPKIIDWQSLDPEEFGEDMVDAIRNLNSDDPEDITSISGGKNSRRNYF